jgi:hypothetical protein
MCHNLYFALSKHFEYLVQCQNSTFSPIFSTSGDFILKNIKIQSLKSIANERAHQNWVFYLIFRKKYQLVKFWLLKKNIFPNSESVQKVMLVHSVVKKIDFFMFWSTFTIFYASSYIIDTVDFTLGFSLALLRYINQTFHIFSSATLVQLAEHQVKKLEITSSIPAQGKFLKFKFFKYFW